MMFAVWRWGKEGNLLSCRPPETEYSPFDAETVEFPGSLALSDVDCIHLDWGIVPGMGKPDKIGQ